MPKEPESTIMKLLILFLENAATYISYILIAVAGGFVSHISKLRTGEISKFRLVALIADMAVSGFAGLLIALLASSFNITGDMVYFLSGMSGHLGARAIFLMQLSLENKLKSLGSKAK